MINFWNNTFGICLHKSILSFENGSNDVARHCYLHQKRLEQEMSEFEEKENFETGKEEETTWQRL